MYTQTVLGSRGTRWWWCLWWPGWWVGGDFAWCSHLFQAFLAPWWCGCVVFHPEVGSRHSVIQVAGFSGHWCDSSGHELKQITQFGHKVPGKKWRNHWVWANCVFSMMIGIPFLPPTGSLTDVDIHPTWKKAVTYLPKPPDFGNLRDSCKWSQLLLPHQTFRILPLCFEPTQGCQKCGRSHRDARWIGGLFHQSSNLSCLHYSLQRVVVCACSYTRFEWHKVVNYLANLQTT